MFTLNMRDLAVEIEKDWKAPQSAQQWLDVLKNIDLPNDKYHDVSGVEAISNLLKYEHSMVLSDDVKHFMKTIVEYQT